MFILLELLLYFVCMVICCAIFAFIVSIVIFFIIKILYKIKHKTKTIKLKSLFKTLFRIITSIYFILFLAGECSYKYLDPQYYRFKGLCKSAEKVIIGKPTEDYDDTKYIIHKKIHSRIKEVSFRQITDNQVEFYINNTYFYYNYGLFLKGDEGRGWYIDFDDEKLDCKDLRKDIND